LLCFVESYINNICVTLSRWNHVPQPLRSAQVDSQMTFSKLGLPLKLLS